MGCIQIQAHQRERRGGLLTREKLSPLVGKTELSTFVRKELEGPKVGFVVAMAADVLNQFSRE